MSPQRTGLCTAEMCTASAREPGARATTTNHISLLWESSLRGAQAGTETDPDQQNRGSYTIRTFLPHLATWNLPLFLGRHCHSPELPSAENVLCPLLPGNWYSRAFYKLSLCWPKWLDRHPQNGPITSARWSKKGFKNVKNNAFIHLELLPQIFKRWWVDGCVTKQVSKMLIIENRMVGIQAFTIKFSQSWYIFEIFHSRMLASIKMAMSHVT